jgi:hypothetical protein
MKVFLYLCSILKCCLPVQRLNIKDSKQIETLCFKWALIIVMIGGVVLLV